jgi:hypothetical protein
MKKVFLFFVLSALVLSTAQVSTVLGCALIPGDRWYSIKPEITNNPLSNILGIAFPKGNEIVTFTNRGLTSNLYIASKDVDGLYPGYHGSQRNYRPAEKIIGKDFDPNVLISVESGLPKGVYEFNSGWSKTRIGDINDKNTGTTTLGAVLDSTDNYHSKQQVGDDRPNYIPIPLPDHQIMYAFYQGTRYDIELILNYSLNDSYDTNKSKNACKGEGLYTNRNTRNIKAKQSSWPVVASILVLLAASSIALGVRLDLQSKTKKTRKQIRQKKTIIK